MSMITMGLGSDGSGLEVAVALNPIEIPIAIKEVESIPIEVELKSIEIRNTPHLIGVDLDPKTLKTLIKDCNG